MTDEMLVRVMKLEYLPVLTYRCSMCDTKKEVIQKSKYVNRKLFQGDFTSKIPEDLYQPIYVTIPYCPSCHQRMIYDPKGDFPILYIYGRNSHKKRVKLTVNNIEPEFFIRTSDIDTIKNIPPINKFRIKRVEKGDYHSANYRETPYSKVVVYLPSDVHSRYGQPPSLRDEFPFTAQADVLFEVKAWAELQIQQYITVPIKPDNIYSKHEIKSAKIPEVHIEPHYFVYDLETEYMPEEDTTRTTQGRVPIYSISGYSNYANAFFEFYHHKSMVIPDTEMVNLIVSKIHDYVHGKYCPKCKTPYSDGYDRCSECDVQLTSLNIVNPQFSNFLENTPIHIVSAYTEKTFLCKFLDVMSKANVDIMGGWNSGFFDDPTLTKRIRKLVRDPQIPVGGDTIFGVLPMDFMDAWLGTKRSKNVEKSLNAVGAREIGAYKFEYADDINSLYKHDLPTLLAYNLIDSALVVGINNKMKPV